MANTYTKIYIHAVFAVKNRDALIPKSLSDELYRYMAGIIKAEDQFPIKIGGVPNHVHLAFAIKPTITISDLIRVVKANSSKWINEQKNLPFKFEWQRGFGAFSCSQSHVEKLIKYIDNQENHHRKRSFKEEYLELLKSFQVEYDEKYVFDWISE